MDKNPKPRSREKEVEEDDNLLDEERILLSLEKARKEKFYDHEEVWKMLSLD